MKKSYAAIDLIFSLGVMFIIIFFVLSMEERAQKDFLISKEEFKLNLDATDLCDYLINNKGVPSNWSNLSSVSNLGFQKENSFDLDFVKLSLCANNTLKIREKLKINSYISLSLFNVSNSQEIFSCKKIPSIYKIYTKSFCYSRINKSIVKFEVGLWK